MSHKVLVIAEIGLNHNGSLDLARQLIDVAVDAGADCVKFQKRTVDVVYTAEELAKPRETPFGKTNGDLKRKLEFGAAEYLQIDAYCKLRGIEWTASCWDGSSVDFVASFKPPFLKIASASLTDDALLSKHAHTGLPLILSTGMSELWQIDEAVQGPLAKVSDLTLLHCTSTYPCSIEELNLLAIPALKARYGLPVGFSSHCVSPWPILGAVALGATVVECHLTCDRTLFGTDQSASLEPEAFKKIVREIRDAEKWMGDGIKKVYDSEKPIAAKLRKR